MSVRLQMLQVARLAPRLLGDSIDRVATFLRSQINRDGGFNDRAGSSDLYYTVFGIESLFALRMDPTTPALKVYLESFGSGDGLDIVHLSCLARCWAMFPQGVLDSSVRNLILDRMEHYRSADGGYQATPRANVGTLYGCFLAMGAYQDLEQEIINSRGLIDCIQSLRATDGGYANQVELPMGLTPSTAAAVTILHQLGEPIDSNVSDWLLSRVHPEGGFYATPAAPIPDLLSTATALHALSILGTDVSTIREPTLDFIDTLWSSRGGFLGNWEDEALDCEYTYYGLLALGHLSLGS